MQLFSAHSFRTSDFRALVATHGEFLRDPHLLAVIPKRTAPGPHFYLARDATFLRVADAQIMSERLGEAPQFVLHIEVLGEMPQDGSLALRPFIDALAHVAGDKRIACAIFDAARNFLRIRLPIARAERSAGEPVRLGAAAGAVLRYALSA